MRLNFIILFLCVFTGFHAKAQNINFDFGIGPTIAFNNATFGAQVKVAYFMADRFHPALTFSYFIADDVNYGVDLDARYQLITAEEYYISPLVGINLSRFDGQTGIGLNAGLFWEIKRDIMSFYLEPKFVLDTESFLVLSGGIYF